MDKRKRGIALFITLMVIASIMSIIAVSFSYLEKVQKDAGRTSAIIQGDLLYQNTIDILQRFFPKKQDNSEKLKLIYTMPLILTEAKSGFELALTCEPLFKGVPINWLDSSSWKMIEKTNLANDVLTRIIEQYNIEEPSALEELILKEITGKVDQNQEYKSRLQQQKGIVSKEQFYRIIANYRLLYDDSNVIKVPWEKYFSFSQVNAKSKIDGVYLTPELISIAFEIPLEIVLDSWIIGESNLLAFLTDNTIVVGANQKKIYSNKALNALHCEQRYAYQDGLYKFNFDYIEGRSANFEFNGKE